MNTFYKSLINLKIQGIKYHPRSTSSHLGDLGSGAGRGGGGGGSIREAGGGLGKMEAAREEQYFYNKQKEQLQKLRTSTVIANDDNSDVKSVQDLSVTQKTKLSIKTDK